MHQVSGDTGRKDHSTCEGLREVSWWRTSTGGGMGRGTWCIAGD